MLVGAIVLTFTYTTPIVGWLVVVMSMAVIGVHGMLSGTASMDFGGAQERGHRRGHHRRLRLSWHRRHVPDLRPGPAARWSWIAAGHITGPATDPANWQAWPMAMIPIAALGLFLAARLWNAKPKPKSA